LFGESGAAFATDGGMADAQSRIVVEKGRWARTSRPRKALNATLARYFEKAQIYGVDH